MDVDRLIRRGALLAIPAIAVGLYFARSEPADAPDPSASSTPPSDPLGLEPAPGSKLADDIARRGEAALGARPGASPSSATPEERAPDRQEKEKAPPKPKAVHVARDLPIAEPTTHSASRAPARPERARRPSQCGGVEVRAITAATDPKWAFASLAPAPEDSASLKQQGDSIGSWRVDAIEWDRVWLRSGAGRCAVTLSDGVREAAELGKTLKKKGAVVLEAAPVVEPWRLPGEIANSLERDGDGSYSIERAMIKPLFDRGGELMSGIRLSPLVRAERVVGVAFEGIREDSLLERLGIESGDVLLSLDDKPCTTLAAVVDALDSAREADRMVARLERQGQPFDLEVRVR